VLFVGIGKLRSFGAPCDKYRRWIFLYLDDQLREPRLCQFKDHLAGCAECRMALADRRRFVLELRAARAGLSPSMDLRARVEEILRMATTFVMLAGIAWIRRLIR
jgi:hypothetical protein